MKFIRPICFLLIVCFVSVCMVGCHSNGETSSSKYFDRDGNYIVPDTMLEIIGWNTQGTDYDGYSNPDGKNAIDRTAAWLVDKTNVRFEGVYGNDGGSWDAKLTRLLLGDNMPDMVFCGAYQGPAHFNKLDELGQLHKLTPQIIQKIAPDVWRRTPAECWEAFTTEDGYITGIPYRIHESCEEPFDGYTQEEKEYIRQIQIKHTTDVTYMSTQCLYIRDDILKDFFPNAKSYAELVLLLEETNAPLGNEMLDIPIHSTQEFVDFLYAIQAKGYTENGKTVYPFGYTGGDNWLALSQFGASLMGYQNHNYSGTINWDTKRYELFLLKEPVKESARIQNQMLNDEVIEPVSLVQPGSKYLEKAQEGLYAIVAMDYLSDARTFNQKLRDNGKTFQYRPFILQIPNRKEYPAFREENLWMLSLAFTNEMTESEIYQALNWINVQYTDEWEEICSWGTKEADLYVVTEDGTRRFKDERLNRYYLEGDAEALENVDLESIGISDGSAFPIFPLRLTRYAPAVYNRCYLYAPTGDSGFRFPPNSEHVKNVVQYPPTQIWSAIYADIPEVIEFWSTREQWESKIRIALGASSENFEDRWSELVATIESIIDVKQFEDACTKAVRPYLDQLLQ